MADVVMSLNASPVDVEVVTAVMSIATLTRVMQTRPVIFFDMPRYAGVQKRWRQLLRLVILMLQEMCCPRPKCETGRSWLNFNAFPRIKWPIDILSTRRVRQGTYYYYYFTVLVNRRAEIVRWVAESKRPFVIVKDRGFQSLMKTGRPAYQIPSPATVSRDVKTVFVKVHKRIAKMLQVCISFNI